MKLLEKKDVAEYLKVSVPTVERFMRDGLPFHKVGKRFVRFYQEEVDKWIIENNKGE